MQYSSEEDDEWDEVEDTQDPSQGFTISVDRTALEEQMAREDQPIEPPLVVSSTCPIHLLSNL